MPTGCFRPGADTALSEVVRVGVRETTQECTVSAGEMDACQSPEQRYMAELTWITGLIGGVVAVTGVIELARKTLLGSAHALDERSRQPGRGAGPHRGMGIGAMKLAPSGCGRPARPHVLSGCTCAPRVPPLVLSARIGGVMSNPKKPEHPEHPSHPEHPDHPDRPKPPGPGNPPVPPPREVG